MNIAGVLLAGAIVGLGIFLCVRELFPAPPALTAALDRFTPQGRRPASDVGPAATTTQVGRWLAARIAGTALDVRLPRPDLALLGKSIEGYLVQKVAMALFGLSVPTVLWTLLMPSVPWLVSTGSGLVYGIIMFAAPDLAVRSQAREAREEFRGALIAYLDLIKMARAAGAGPGEALESPARVCHGWAFQRIAGALDPASRGTRDPWDELARLAEEIGVRELADTATIARRAGTQGARILESLTAKAASLREQQLARALTRAKSRTETMTVPVALSVLGYLILLGYPAYARIVGGRHPARDRRHKVKHLSMRPYLITALQLSRLIARAHKGVQTRADRGRDRGANVVETIIIVAGFAILAAGIYAAVAGKVHTWIAKMP